MAQETFTHHTASVNGIQLHYVMAGHGDPLVLLHGYPETWYAYVIPLTQGGGMWFRCFHLVPELPEALVAGRERLYLSWFYHNFSRQPDAISESEIDEYVRTYSLPGGMRSAFEYYRTYFEDTKQGQEYRKTKLTMPVLAIGADSVFGAAVQQCMENAAVNVRGIVLENCGHFVAEEQPLVLTQQLLNFFSENNSVQ